MQCQICNAQCRLVKSILTNTMSKLTLTPENLLIFPIQNKLRVVSRKITRAAILLNYCVKNACR